MTESGLENLVTLTGLISASIVILLICIQVFRREYLLLRYFTYFAILVTVGDVAFGKYYAGTAPARLKPIEATKPSVAIKGYTKAIRFNPGDADLYFRRGRTELILNRYTDAVQDFTQALALSPNDPRYLASRAFAFALLGQLNLAKNDLDLAVKGGYADSETRILQGMVAESQGQYSAAVADYTDALGMADISPESRCNALMYLGSVHTFLMKDYVTGAKDYTQALANCSGEAREDVLVNRGTAYSKAADYKAAFADWDAALELDPNDAVLFKNRGESYIDLNRPDLALVDYSRYLQLRPDDANSYLLRSELYEHLGDPRSAELDRRKANDLINTNRARTYPPYRSPFAPST